MTEHDAPLFRADHNYLTIWGYWNGSAEMTEDRDEAHVQPVDLGEAVARGLITTSLGMNCLNAPASDWRQLAIAIFSCVRGTYCYRFATTRVFS